METFILFLWMTGYKAGGPAFQEFDSKAACIYAGETIKRRFRDSRHVFVDYLCLPRRKG